jgi:phosphoglucosamine mutase
LTLFGTDGIRGVANLELTPELALAVGRAAAAELAGGSEDPRVLIARDTRASGPMLEAALVAGIASQGADVGVCGVLPTPAVAHLVRQLGAHAGVVISGSHNPYQDNGIKFFGPDGGKLAEGQERGIEERIEAGSQPTGRERLGRIERIAGAGDLYVELALRCLSGQSLAGLKVVVDCANGAAFQTSPQALRRAGAEVLAINDQPDGININADCGSTYPAGLCEQVVRSGAGLGLAHDGDADRVIGVDERGEIIDGDAMIAIMAIEAKQHGRLPGNLVVGTVMANLGFRRAMIAEGIELVETPVGDRYVVEAMRRTGAAIGGEQSGHIILMEHLGTGDGLMTGLSLAGTVAGSGKSLSELAQVVQRLPQVLVNVKVKDRDGLAASERVAEAIAEAEQAMGSDGRILIRPSGTEPLIRVMVEATEESVAHRTAASLASLISAELG